MLTASPATRVFLAAGATDMRKSFDTLTAIVRNTMSFDPTDGHLYVFCKGNRNRLKVLFFDGSGLWVCAKRLEKGTFAWPRSNEVSSELSHEDLAALLGGIDLRGARRRRWYQSEKNREKRAARY